MHDYFRPGFLPFFETFGNPVTVREIAIPHLVCKARMCVFRRHEPLIFAANDFLLIINIVKNCKFSKNCD